MSYKFLDIASTPSVRAAQAANGSREMWEKFKGHRTFDRFTEDEAAFIAERDSFYMATVSETRMALCAASRWPSRFLKVLDEKTLGFADFRGNLQYISVGNVAANDRAALILVDYPNQARLEILAPCRDAQISHADSELAERLACPATRPSWSVLVCCTLRRSTGIAAAHHAAIHDRCGPGGGCEVAGAHYGA